ncbi:MAG: cytidine deaminase, partial [Chitinophagaceae bacterium]
MKKSEHIISFTEYHSINELTPTDAALLEAARQATADAYAPY